MAVKLCDIADAMRYANLGVQYYYHVPSGEVMALPDPSFAIRRDRTMEKDMDAHPMDYVNLPEQYVVDEEVALEDFCESLEDGEAAAILNQALLSGAPVGSIYQVLEELQLREPYETFLDELYLDAAREWCSDMEIPWEEDAG